MFKLFDTYIEPIFNERQPKKILEIGVCEGAGTWKLLNWAKKNNASVTSLEPAAWTGEIPEDIKKPFTGFKSYRGTPKEVKAFTPTYIEQIYKEGLDEHWHCLKTTSEAYLSSPEAEAFDAYLIDGDHNYYTVHRELELIQPSLKANSIILMHDVGWKWGRRDHYYDKTIIPKEFINPARQGVLSAVDDFLTKYKGYKTGPLCAIDDVENVIKQQFKERRLKSRVGAVLKTITGREVNSVLSSKYYDQVNRIFERLNKHNFYNDETKVYRFEILTRDHDGLGIIEKVGNV